MIQTQLTVTSSEMLDFLRERFGGHAQLQKKIQERRASKGWAMTIMSAVAELYAEALKHDEGSKPA